MLLAGVVSWFASTWPDGLEWSYLGHRYAAAEKAVANESAVVAAVDQWQSKWSPMTDYGRRQAPLGELPPDGAAEAASTWPNLNGWRSLAGVLGTIVTLGILYGASPRDAEAATTSDRPCTGFLASHCSPETNPVSMHHHFIDRFAMGDSPVHRLDARAKLRGGAGVQRGADQFRPLPGRRLGADGRIAVCDALVRPRSGRVCPAAGCDPQPVHPHARADEPGLRPGVARGGVRPVALHRQRRLADGGQHRDQVRPGGPGFDGDDVHDPLRFALGGDAASATCRKSSSCSWGFSTATSSC